MRKTDGKKRKRYESRIRTDHRGNKIARVEDVLSAEQIAEGAEEVAKGAAGLGAENGLGKQAETMEGDPTEEEPGA